MMIYVSGALKASSDLLSARALYENAARVIRLAGHQAYLPHQHTDPQRASRMSASQVFKRDLAALDRCDGVVVFLREPSLGVGAEIALCAQSGVPMLGLSEPADEISRFATGLLEEAGAQVVTYSDDRDLSCAIERFLLEIKSKAAQPRSRLGLSAPQQTP
ncbi:MAG: nucleoside 2-deoxyribosyltransferase [Pseudomonadota bacterium]